MNASKKNHFVDEKNQKFYTLLKRIKKRQKIYLNFYHIQNFDKHLIDISKLINNSKNKFEIIFQLKSKFLFFANAFDLFVNFHSNFDLNFHIVNRSFQSNLLKKKKRSI